MKNKKVDSTETELHTKAQSIPFTENKILQVAIIIILGLIVYSNTYSGSMHLDDISSIMFNRAIQNDWTIASIWKYSQNRFLPYLSLAYNYKLGELETTGYHVFNIIIHISNGLLVYWLTQLIFSTPAMKTHSGLKSKIALFTALLFISHPLATQSVTYITQRIASMAALFYFFSMALYIKGRITEGNTKYLYLTGAIITAILSFLSKENSYTLPFSILLLELFFFNTEKIRINVKSKSTIIAILVSVGFIAFAVLKFSTAVFKTLKPDFTTDYKTISSVDYLLTQLSVIPKYIQLLILPINQNLDYDYPLANSFFEFSTIVGCLIILALLSLAIYLVNKNRIVSFGILFFFLAISIESSIIPIADLIFEHRTYLPSFGFFILLSSLLLTLPSLQKKQLGIGILSIVVLINSVLAYNRNKIWENDELLWTDVISKSPNKVRPYNSRGSYYWLNERNEEAIKDYSKAIALHPDYLEAYFNRAQVYYKQKRWAEAINDYNQMIRLDSNNVDWYLTQANMYQNLKNSAAALIDYNKILKLDPKNSATYYNRGVLYQDMQQNDNAISDYTNAIKYKSDYVEAYINRGNIYSSLQQYENAINDFNKAISYNPKFDLAYNNRGIALMSDGKYKEAIADFSVAISLNPNYAKAIYNRGLAAFRSGDKNSACKDWQLSLEKGYQIAATALQVNCK
jgi:tetratricopeptide (TPR) repeat protein